MTPIPSDESNPLARLQTAQKRLGVHPDKACPKCKRQKLLFADEHDGERDLVTRIWTCTGCGYSDSAVGIPISTWETSARKAWETKAADLRARQALIRCPDCGKESIDAEEAGVVSLGTSQHVWLSCKTPGCTFVRRKIERSLGGTLRGQLRYAALILAIAATTLMVGWAIHFNFKLPEVSSVPRPGMKQDQVVPAIPPPASSEGDHGDKEGDLLPDISMLRMGTMKLEQPIPSSDGDGGIALREGGLVDDRLKFHLVAGRGGEYEIEDLFVEIIGTAECELRDECVAIQALSLKTSFLIPLSSGFSRYRLVPPQSSQEFSWTLVGPDVSTFDVQLVYEPYKLFVLKVVVNVRDLVKESTMRLESDLFGTVSTPNGNQGGCHDLQRWLTKKKLTPPTQQEFSAGMSLPAYSLLIHRADVDRGLPVDVKQHSADSYFEEISAIIQGQHLPLNWMPILYELEREAEGKAFAPDRTVAIANSQKWLIMSTKQLSGQRAPELRRIAAYRDRIDALLVDAPPSGRPYWQRGRLVGEVHPACKSREPLVFSKGSKYKLMPPGE